MTGITKDELMQMAIQHGLKRAPVIWHHISVDQDDLVAFFNAILERAAVECEVRASEIRADEAKEQNKTCAMVLNAGAAGVDSARNCIRALKINTGD